MADHPLRPATRRRLGGPLPHQLPDGPRAPPSAGRTPLSSAHLCGRSVWGISQGFPWLSPSEGQVTHVLLTRPPLGSSPKGVSPHDLHVLGTPPAFTLSQDQTLHKNFRMKSEGCYPYFNDPKSETLKSISTPPLASSIFNFRLF